MLKMFILQSFELCVLSKGWSNILVFVSVFTIWIENCESQDSILN